jgi:ABC-type proline/glycine betaine transport system permease subunit
LCSTGKFAGIVYAQASDTINIVDETKQKVATIPSDAVLAACIPASAIREFLEAR